MTCAELSIWRFAPPEGWEKFYWTPWPGDELDIVDPVSTVNCLAIAPGKVVMSAGISQPTRARLDALGVEVMQLAYENMYLGGGGIHCSTCPLVRDSVY